MKAKKRFGQHFLNSPHYLRLIADVADVRGGEKVLEIGPGKGSLTRELLAREAKVIAIEKDRDLLPLLHESFADDIKKRRLILIEKDILDVTSKDLPTSYKLVANIPYYITGAILRNFLTARKQPSSMTLLVQKEVAERIAKEEKESLLSLSVKAYGEPHVVQKVPRGAFSPAPKVDSAILHIANISRRHFKSKKEEENFFTLLHLGFSGKRKQLLGLLSKKFERIHIGKVFSRLEIKPDTRGEDVPIKVWLKLAEEFS